MPPKKKKSSVWMPLTWKAILPAGEIREYYLPLSKEEIDADLEHLGSLLSQEQGKRRGGGGRLVHPAAGGGAPLSSDEYSPSSQQGEDENESGNPGDQQHHHMMAQVAAAQQQWMPGPKLPMAALPVAGRPHPHLQQPQQPQQMGMQMA